MLNLLQTISFFGLELNLDESNTMSYLLIAVVVLFAITLVILSLLLWSTRPKKDESAVEPVEAVATNALPEVTVLEDDDEQVEVANSSEIIATLKSADIAESENGAIVHGADGSVVYYTYNKSFKAKLIQAKDEVREYYNELKNFVMGYNKVKTKISWKQESVNFGREKVCWFVLRGKSLYLYLPLNPDDYADTKYKVERDKAKRYEELPCLYKISNDRRAKYATELIATVLDSYGAERKEKPYENFLIDYPYYGTITLIEKGLIKVTKSNRAFSIKE